MKLRFAGRASDDLQRLHKLIADKDPATEPMRRQLLTRLRVLLDQPGARRVFDP